MSPMSPEDVTEDVTETPAVRATADNDVPYNEMTTISQAHLKINQGIPYIYFE